MVSELFLSLPEIIIVDKIFYGRIQHLANDEIPTGRDFLSLYVNAEDQRCVYQTPCRQLFNMPRVEITTEGQNIAQNILSPAEA